MNTTSAWEGIGTPVSEESVGTEVLEKAGLLGWNVRKCDAVSFDPVTRDVISNPKSMHTVRTNPTTGLAEILGTVSTQYPIIQNEALADTLDAITGLSGADFVTAGEYGNGKMFITMRLPDQINIAGIESEAHDLYLVAANGHDGKTAFEVMLTTVRLACSNTLGLARRTAEAKWTVRHTTGAEERIKEIKAGLEHQQLAIAQFEEDAKQLIATPMSDAEFDKFITETWGVVDEAKERAKSIEAQRKEKLHEMFHLPTSEEIRGSAWMGLQAVTGYVDHFESPSGSPAKRRERSVLGAGAKRKEAAYNRLMR